MANNFKASNLAVNTSVDAVAVLANSGKLRIYDGTQPATVDTAISGPILLAELTMNATAFGSSVAGVATANAITQDSSNDASGTATWFRLLKSDGTSALFDGSVGTSGCDLNLNSVALSIGAITAVSSFTLTLPKA